MARLYPNAGSGNKPYGGIFDGCNNPCSKDNFLPSFTNVDDVNAVGTTFPDIRLHMSLQVSIFVEENITDGSFLRVSWKH